MSASPGRELLISLDLDGGGVAEIVGQTSGSLVVNREAIDITAKTDDGIRTLLPDIGTFGFEMSFEAVLNDAAFLTEVLDPAPTALYSGSITIGSFGTVTGNFYIGSMTITGDDGPNYIAISGTITSSGTPTFTPTP